jgi:hypothetical protein
LGFLDLFDEGLKKIKKWEEEDEERGEKLDVAGSWYDAIDTHNPIVLFLNKILRGLN